MSFVVTRRFLPLFVTQFLGAFNDNLFKTALVMLVTFRFAQETAMPAALLVTAAAGIFILPFFLFSATAGQLADKYDRAAIARLSKQAEIVLMIAAAAGFLLPHVPFLLAVLFLMGAQSAFFGPVKYALLPQHLSHDELLPGNAWVEAGTFIAILTGTLAGGLVAMHPAAQAFASGFCILVAAAGYAASRAIPSAPGPMPDLRVNPRFWVETVRMLALSRAQGDVFRAMLAISWFWFLGATYLAQVPVYARDYLGGDESVVTLLLVVFTVGIAAGSAFSARYFARRATLVHVPYTLIAMGIFGAAVCLQSVVPADVAVSAAAFMAAPQGWLVAGGFFMTAAAGGAFVVPLYTFVQRRSPPVLLARMIASLNILNAFLMVLSALFSFALLAAGFGIPAIFLSVALLNLPLVFAFRGLSRLAF